MQIRTPKKYRGVQRRSVFPWKRFVLWFFVLALIAGGISIYQNIELFRPQVDSVVSTLAAQGQERVQTATAPTLTPTPDPSNQVIQANNFWDQGSINEAVRLYERVVDLVPNDVTVHTRVALGLIAQGRVDDALDYAERAVTADPFSSDAWAMRSWAMDWAGRPGEAIASGLHALELNPDNARAMAYLGEAYFGLGQTQRAQTIIEDALQIDPESAEALRARGFIKWYGLFDLDGAIVDLRAAYDIAQADASATSTFIAVDIAGIEQGRGNFQEAIDILESVLETNPENTQALFQLGALYFSSIGDPSQASSYLSRCVDFSPDSIVCHYMLGRSQDRLELTAQAAESFAQAVELGSQNARHYWWAGRSQISLGNCNRALEYLEVGYELALASEDAQLVSDFEDILPLCQANFGPSNTPIPEDAPADDAAAAEGDL